jgi:hypothetical protein
MLFPAACFSAAASPWAAQGIEAEIPQQTAKRFARNCSGKPGFFAREGGQKNAPKFFFRKIPHSSLFFSPGLTNARIGAIL